ncbi:MAG TPA: DUF6624 domain-containing protein [Gemmatimonadaceae bacterium]
MNRSLATAGTIVLAFVLQGCRGSDQPSSTDLAEARKQLETRIIADQKVREAFGAGGRLDSAQIVAMMRTDSANTAWLKSYVARWGWPTSAQIGDSAVNAAFIIVQHATQDTAFMRSMLPFITESYRRGDLKGQDVALLTDRLAIKSGKPQIYGTQLSFKEGKLVLDPIADSAHVDERRQTMGMPPLSVYLHMIDSVMRSP